MKAPPNINPPLTGKSTPNGALQKQPRDHVRGRQRPYNRTSHRLRELERVINTRHGRNLDTDDAGIYLVPVAQCLKRFHESKNGAATFDDILGRPRFWASTWMPLVPDDVLREATAEAIDISKLEHDDMVARSLRLTNAEREALDIRTIGACDMSRAARARAKKARRRLRDRLRVAATRRNLGVKPRAVYLAESLAQTKPWLAEGMSERTWYRRQAASKVPNGRGPSPHSYLNDRATHLCHEPKPLTPDKQERALLRGVVPWACTPKLAFFGSIACFADVQRGGH
jgi:hypothetical protein